MCWLVDVEAELRQSGRLVARPRMVYVEHRSVAATFSGLVEVIKRAERTDYLIYC